MKYSASCVKLFFLFLSFPSSTSYCYLLPMRHTFHFMDGVVLLFPWCFKVALISETMVIHDNVLIFMPAPEHPFHLLWNHKPTTNTTTSCSQGSKELNMRNSHLTWPVELVCYGISFSHEERSSWNGNWRTSTDGTECLRFRQGKTVLQKRLENQAPKLPVNFNFLIIPLSWWLGSPE